MKILSRFALVALGAFAGLAALTSSAQAGVSVGIGFGPSWGYYHHGHHGHWHHRHHRHRSYYYAPAVTYYAEPEYVYVEPEPVIVESAPPAPRVATEKVAPEPLPPTQSAPPAYGSRIGKTDEVKSPHSEFRLKTRAARNTVVYDAYTGQAFRIP
jgi:hypothetical protein